MIKCNYCEWSIDNKKYEGLQILLERACLEHYKNHTDDRILADNFTKVKT